MYTVLETAEKLGVSKVTVYAKLKKYKSKVKNNNGKTYVDDKLLNLLKDDLKVNGINPKDLKEETKKVNINSDIYKDNIELIEINKDLTNTIKDLNVEYITSLKLEIESLKEQLKEKDKQIESMNDRIAEANKLTENSQVLLKEEQQKATNQLLLEEHLENLDNKINDVKEKMNSRKADQMQPVGFFKKIFK